MRARAKALGVLVGGGVLVIAAPYLGAFAARRVPSAALDWPPRPGPLDSPAFAWPAFVGLLVAVILVGLALAASIAAAPRARARRRGRGYPWWGWAALAWVALWWALAWGRLEWFAPLQRYTFTPLWLGAIVAVNALAWRRSGRCLLVDRPGLLGSLFAVSVPFWWVFEILNAFARNWHYQGLEPLGALGYAVAASLGFATVLPAVASAWQWLAGYPAIAGARAPALDATRPWAALAVLAGVLALAAVGARPGQAFALLWVGPALVWLGLDGLLGGRPLVASLARGAGGPLVAPALAALTCGLLWELWNAGSYARWSYAIPYVDRFHLFEMPILGYAGYLPFGVVCAVVIDLTSRLISGRAWRPGSADAAGR